jgi:hypothetical protein
MLIQLTPNSIVDLDRVVLAELCTHKTTKLPYVKITFDQPSEPFIVYDENPAAIWAVIVAALPKPGTTVGNPINPPVATK